MMIFLLSTSAYEDFIGGGCGAYMISLLLSAET